MNKTVCLITGFALLSAFVCGCEPAEEKAVKIPKVKADAPVDLAPGEHELSFEAEIVKTVSSRYLIYLPKGYGETQKSWPLIMYLHGARQSGDDLQKVKTDGPLKYVAAGEDFPFIVLAPQCAKGQWWAHRVDVMANLLNHVTKNYNVDKDRIYLTGINMGGHGSWLLAWEYPERFAAIAPVAGWGSPGKACKLKDVAVWAFHGAKDAVVPPARSQEMVDALKACSGDVKLTVYPDAEHNIWGATYNNKVLYDWFLSKKK